MKCTECGSVMDLYACRNPGCAANPTRGIPIQRKDGYREGGPAPGPEWSGLQGATAEVKQAVRERKKALAKEQAKRREAANRQIDLMLQTWGLSDPEERERKRRLTTGRG